MFNFQDLDERTRTLMLKEVELDESNTTLYISKRLNSYGKIAYSELLKEAVTTGDSQTLAQALKQHINSHELRRDKSVKIPYNAHETLAEGEFNRFYIRALCLRAIEEGMELVVYRAKPVTNARSASQSKIGQSVDPQLLLQDLRNNVGVDTALGLPSGPNSGLSLKIS